MSKKKIDESFSMSKIPSMGSVGTVGNQISDLAKKLRAIMEMDDEAPETTVKAKAKSSKLTAIMESKTPKKKSKK